MASSGAGDERPRQVAGFTLILRLVFFRKHKGNKKCKKEEKKNKAECADLA